MVGTCQEYSFSFLSVVSRLRQDLQGCSILIKVFKGADIFLGRGVQIILGVVFISFIFFFYMKNKRVIKFLTVRWGAQIYC